MALRALVVVLSAAAVATSQAPAASRPTSRALCALDDFANAPGPYRRARPAAGTKPARIDAEDSCVSGDLARCRRIPLDPASTWIAGARLGDFVCVTEGATSGWVRHDELLLEPAAERPIADWRGTWEHEAGSATVTISSKDDRTLEVKGEATWARALTPSLTSAQHAVDDAEDRDRHADAERERQRGGRGEARALAKAAERVAQVCRHGGMLRRSVARGTARPIR
ncbi:MAG TPA: hypothetical protein VGN09_05510 [Vicinamibacteria bacterium]